MADCGNYNAVIRPCLVYRAAQLKQMIYIYNFPLGGRPRGYLLAVLFADYHNRISFLYLATRKIYFTRIK